MNKDYRVTIKVRNANLLRAIEQIGEMPGQTFADKAGISYHHLNGLISCKISPLKPDGSYREGVINLCEYLNKMPCDLFSQDQIEPLKTNSVDVELTYEQCAELSYNPMTIESIQQNELLYEALERLTTKEKEVIKKRFGLEGSKQTIGEVSKSFNVSRERIRQIEARALRKLRHPSISDRLIAG